MVDMPADIFHLTQKNISFKFGFREFSAILYEVAVTDTLSWRIWEVEIEKSYGIWNGYLQIWGNEESNIYENNHSWKVLQNYKSQNNLLAQNQSWKATVKSWKPSILEGKAKSWNLATSFEKPKA